MPDKRRRIFYVDRIFQKRVICFFLGWNFVVVISNFVFYILHLKGLVEDNLYKSHIKIFNLAEAFSQDVLRFNLILALASIIAVVIFYLFIRFRIKSFFSRIKGNLQSRMGRPFEKTSPLSLKEEFADIDMVLQGFFKDVDEKTEQDRKRLSFLKDRLTEL
ncbi:hypothetical protein ACFLT2_03135 [Acidobacteriota bacterium]